LDIHLFKPFKKGGRGRSESREVYNLICRSLFHYYSDLFYYSTMFPSKRKEGDSEREGDRERGRGRRERGIV
jgi:hypothetical protein